MERNRLDVPLLIPAEFYWCDHGTCEVYIFFNVPDRGGVCPGCNEIGSRVGNG